MSRVVKSMRGEQVDFDLMDIKNQIKNTDKTMQVEARENFIDKKLKRSISRAKSKIQEAFLKKDVDALKTLDTTEDGSDLIDTVDVVQDDTAQSEKPVKKINRKRKTTQTVEPKED